jgi:hypothetical protein
LATLLILVICPIFGFCVYPSDKPSTFLPNPFKIVKNNYQLISFIYKWLSLNTLRFLFSYIKNFYSQIFLCSHMATPLFEYKKKHRIYTIIHKYFRYRYSYRYSQFKSNLRCKSLTTIYSRICLSYIMHSNVGGFLGFN